MEDTYRLHPWRACKDDPNVMDCLGFNYVVTLVITWGLTKDAITAGISDIFKHGFVPELKTTNKYGYNTYEVCDKLMTSPYEPRKEQIRLWLGMMRGMRTMILLVACETGLPTDLLRLVSQLLYNK